MPWRNVQNVHEKKSLEAIYNEATSAGLKLAVLRMVRSVGFGSTQIWNGFVGFRTLREEKFDGTVVRSARVDPDRHLEFFPNNNGDAYALVVLSDNGEVVKRNVDVLIDCEASGDHFWDILTEDVAAEIKLQAAKRRKEWGQKRVKAKEVDFEANADPMSVAELVGGKNA